MIDPSYRVDEREVRYQPPQTHMAEVLQRPLYMITAEAVTAAYIKDWRSSRKNKP